jgi:23S rRNA (guanosine2251-2'-O)-methyltransferase
MYNDLMPIQSYEIRICNSCGLRYPLAEAHPFGTRCPVCMGETRVVVKRELIAEPSAHTFKEEPFDSPALAPGASVAQGKRGKRLAVLLDNIRSAWNVGSILRSADGFGFSHAHLCGITPTPENESVTKTSLGAEDSVSWSYHKDAVRLVKGLKAEGWKVYGLEEDARATPLESDSLLSEIREQAPRLQVLIVGNEVTGIDPELLDLCDQILYIPMRGEKKSFNVAIAFGIAAYALIAQR